MTTATTITPTKPTAPPLTPADVARLSDEHGKLYELVNGNLVEKPMSMQANWVTGQITFLLKSAYPASKAHVFVEQPTYCFPNTNTGRRPDVALVWTNRPGAALVDEELFIAPDLVVEVVSPTNRYRDLLDRVDEYLKAGVPIVWVVDPVLRSTHVYHRDGSVLLLHDTDIMKDEPLLPGLELRIADFFPVVQQQAAEQGS